MTKGATNTSERRTVRQLLDEVLKTTEQLDAFCLDHFPAVHKQFSSGMGRTARTTLLLESTELHRVVDALSQDHDSELRQACIKLKIPIGIDVQPLPGMPILLAILLAVVLAALAYLRHQLVSSTYAVFHYVAVVLVSLLAAAVSHRLVSTHPLFQTTGRRTGSSALVFVISLGIGLVGVNRVPRPADDWIASGVLTGLPRDKTADVALGDCAPQRVDPVTGHVLIRVHAACDRDPQRLVVRVADHEDQVTHVPRATLASSFVLAWSAPRSVTELWGTVQALGSQRVPGTEVALAGCADALQVPRAVLSRDGGFRIPNLPASCRKPPYHLRVFAGALPFDWQGEGPHDIRILLPGSPAGAPLHVQIERQRQCAESARLRARSAPLDRICPLLIEEERCLRKVSTLDGSDRSVRDLLSVNHTYQKSHHCTESAETGG